MLQARDVGGDHGRLAPQLHRQLGPPVGAASDNLDDGEEPAVGTVDCTSELRVYFNGAGVRDGIAEFNSRGPRFIVEVDGRQVEPICEYLGELGLADGSPLTSKSYAYDLLRWWRLLALLDVAWDQAGRAEVELLVGWMRSASNPQRRRALADGTHAGSVNLRTGKQALSAGYAPSTINHQLTVLAEFYDFHLLFGRGPRRNPVPLSQRRREALAHRSPLEPVPMFRRAPLRQKMSNEHHDRFPPPPPANGLDADPNGIILLLILARYEDHWVVVNLAPLGVRPAYASTR